jgi:hypothetical protein
MIKRIVFILIASLPFIGSECEDDIFTSGNGNTDLQGEWRLVYNSGVLHDVCPGEVVRFQSNTSGIATLRCPPNPNSISRHYNVSNSILTYTETQVSYRIVGIDESQLKLEGMGSGQGRYLHYQRMTSD